MKTKNPFFLLVRVWNGESSETHLFNKEKLVIGRAPECEFSFQLEGVSRHHLSIFRKGEAVWIEDLGSSNGTFVNSKKLPPKSACQYESGAKIQLGLSETYITIDVVTTLGGVVEVKNQLKQEAVEAQKLALEGARFEAKKIMDLAEAEKNKIIQTARSQADILVANGKKSLEDIKTSLQTISIDIELQKREAQRETESLKSRQDELLEDIAKIENKKKESLLDLEGVQKQIDKLNLTKTSVEDGFEKTRNDLKFLKDRMDEEIRSLKTDLIEERERLEKLKLQLKEKEELVSRAEKKKDAAEQKALAFEKQEKMLAFELEEQKKRLHSEIDLSKSKIERLRAEQAQKQKDFESEIDLRRAGFEKELQGKLSAFNLEFEGVQKKARDEFEKKLRDEESRLAIFKLKEMESIEKMKDDAERDLQSRRKYHILEISKNLEALLLSKYSNRFKDSSASDLGLSKDIDSIVSQVIRGEYHSGQDQLKVIMPVDPNIHKKNRMFWVKATGGFIAGILLLAALFHSPEILRQVAVNDKVEATRQIQSINSSKPKYEPEVTLGFKESYVRNILHSRYYVELKTDQVMHEKWTLKLNKVFVEKWGLGENVIVDVISEENQMVRQIMAQREIVDPAFESLSIDRMTRIENEFRDLITPKLGGPERYSLFREIEKEFYDQFVAGR